MKLCRRISLMLVAVLLVLTTPWQSVALSSDEIKEQIEGLEEQEEQLREQMDALEAQLSQNLSDMQSMVRQKEILDQQIVLLHAQSVNTEEQITVYAQLIADRQEQLDGAQARFEELNRKYKQRIRAMEEAGEMSYWAVLFQANSFMDLLDRIDMIQEIASADRQRLQELNAAAQEVESAQEALLAQKELLEQTKLDQQTAQQVLEEKREEADRILRQLVAQGAEYEALLEESEERQEALMEQIAQAEQDLQDALAKEEAAKIPSVSEEGWMTPVVSYRLTSPFGMRDHPILGYPRMHNGVDMACPAMTPIYASRSGVVSVASYQADGAGNYVQLNHGDGYRSIYMHMTYYTVSVGQYVKQGEIIGYVGNTGLSKGNHLHFGISYNGTYVNPMEYL